MDPQISTEVRRPGELKDHPFLVVVVNNPVLETRDGSGVFHPDPLRPDDGRYDAAVAHIEGSLWGELPGQVEGAFIDPALADRARLVRLTVRDAPVEARWSFVTRWKGETLAGRPPDGAGAQPAVVEFIHGQGLLPDVIFAVSGAQHPRRASAWFGTDDRTKGYDVFELHAGGTVERFRHAYWPRTPGVIAIHADERSLTAVHEFSHAISTYNAKEGLDGLAVNAMVVDLYRDDPRGLNKREVNPPEDQAFAIYRSGGKDTAHGWDPHTVYGHGWQSFHCERRSALPAVMNNYFAAGNQVHACVHDTITRQFIQGRIAGRMKR